MADKEVRVRITGDTSDILKKIEKLGDALEDALNNKNIENKSINEAIDDAQRLNKEYEELGETMNDVNDSTKKLSNKNLSDMADEASKYKDTMNEVVESTKDAHKQLESVGKLDGIENMADTAEKTAKAIGEIGDKTKALDTTVLSEMDEYYSSMYEKVQDINKETAEVGKNMSEGFRIDMDSMQQDTGKMKELIGGSLLEAGLEGKMIGDRVASSMKEALGDTKEIMKDFTQALSPDEAIKNFDALIDKLIKTQDEYNDTAAEAKKLKETIKELDAKRQEAKDKKLSNREQLDAIGKEYTKALKELENFQKKYEAHIEEIDGINPDFREHMEALRALQKEYRELTSDKDLGTEFEEAMHRIGESLHDGLGDFAAGAKGLNKLSDAFKNLKAFYDDDKYKEDISLTFLNGIGDVYKETEAYGDKMIDNIEKIIKKMKDLGDTNLDSLINDFESLWKATDDMYRDEDMDKLCDAFDEMKKQLSAMEEINASDPMKKIGRDGKASLELLASMMKALNELDKEMISFMEKDDELKKAKNSDRAKELKELIDAEKEYTRALEISNRVYEDRGDHGVIRVPLDTSSYNHWADELEEYQAALDKANKKVKEAQEEQERLNKEHAKAVKEVYKYEGQYNKLTSELDNMRETLKQGSAEAKEHADAVNKQYRAYENLSQRVKAYLENEDNGILLREKVAKSFKEVADSMEKVYSGSSKLNNADLITKTLAEAAEYVKKLDIVDTKNLQRDLERLGQLVEDKTDKIKRLKEINKEFGTDASKTAYGIEQQSKELRDLADSTKVVVEATDTLRKAWGDISVGGEDHLKLRARTELLTDYAETLKKKVKEIKAAYEEMQGPMTLDQKIALDDWKTYEKNKEALKEYNDAIQEYFDILVDSGGKVDDKFLDDAGKFDVKKFIDDYNRLGTSMQVLTKQANAMRQQVLESLQAEKESVETKRKLAKETLEVAQANKKAAEAQMDAAKQAEREATTMEEQAQAYVKIKRAKEELARTTEELAKAEKDYADINKSTTDDKRIQNAKDLVKQYNEQAEALRKLGAAVKDIELDDIKNFDKSLGTNLKDIFDIDNDIPKKFKDFAEDIKAMFTELGDLNFGDAGDIFKDIGQGIFDMLPTNVKAATGMFTGLTVAVNKLYEAGKQQFFEGLSNIGDKLSPIINMIQNFGDEVRDAFENITDTQIDLGSLMELGPNFEYNMQKVGAIAGSNKQQLEELTKTAERLGGTTQYTASDVAEAFQYMAMAGYDTDQMLNSINGTLNLSIASGTGLAETTDIVTDYMTALGLEANSTNDFVDKLAATVTSSNTTVEKYGMSMRQVASQAGSLGISMTDLSTAIGLQANAGVKGAKAGTALKNVLANMAAPTEKQEKALKQLGFTADETGSYFKTTADGAVDLEATVKQLMTATDDMTKSQKAAVLAQLAGREALPGLMALLSQGAEGWDELSNTIENSTGKVQYWNECMSLAGKSGKDAVAAIDNMKEVFAEVETEALNAGLSTEELSHAIAILGDDGKVSADDVRGLVNVIDSMNTATGEAEQKWRALDQAGDDFVNTGYDYDATIAKITADTTGLSQAKKEAIMAQLDENMTLEEANAILKEYGLTAEEVSFSTLSYADKLEYLRNNLQGCSDEYIKQQLANLGLADSFEEVKEVVSMTDEEFAAYKQNLETVKGMAEQLAEAMDETTKASLLNLASAIENVAISAFNKIKPALKDAVDAVNEFFDAWHNGDENVFTFDGLEKGLAGLADKIRAQKGNVQQAVADLFSGLNTFVNGGSLDSLLDMGTSIVQSICKGIQQAKDSGSLDKAIDGAIQKICNWITTNGPAIEQAGKTIIDSLKSGIERNSDSISAALDTLCSVINTWASSSAQLESTAAIFADKFVNSFVENTTKSIGNKGNEIMQALVSVLNPEMSQHYPEDGGKTEMDPQEQFFKDTMSFKGLWNGLKKGWDAVVEWFTGESYAAELGEETGTQIGEGIGTGISNTKDKTNATANEIGTGIGEYIGNALLSMDVTQLQALQTELTSLQTTTGTVATGMATSFNNIQNSARTSFMGLANIIRNQLLNCTNIVRNQALNMNNIFNNQFTNVANNVRTQMTNVANIIRNQMVNCANIVRNQALNMSNIFNNQFTNMANNVRTQMTNISNIINNQMTNAANMVRTQAINMSNIFNNQFTTMANNVRTQMTNISNIINNQMTNAANIVRTQAVNMSNIFNNQFTTMANNVRTQMTNISNIINNQMTNAANTVRTQAVNMSNIFNNQFTTMANNVRTQMTNISNIINNQMTNACNTVRTQAVNMANIFNNQFTTIANNVRTQMTNVSNIINNQMTNAANTVRTQATNMANIFNNQFTNIANNVRTQMTNVGNIIKNQMTNAANTVRTQATNMANIFKNQFTSIANNVRSQMTSIGNIIKNQMTNAANTVRTQAVSMANVFKNQFTSIANNVRSQMTSVSNIIKNQMTNAANSVRTECVSMANIARNQFVNITNIIKNQATQWASTVRSQAAGMKSAFTSAFSGLSSIAASEMARVLSTVRSYMSQIKSAVSQKMTINVGVNKTVTTTNITKTQTAPASASYAVRAVNASAFALSAPKAMATGYSTNNDTGGGAFSRNKLGYGPLSLEVPLYLDGREIARASASYTQDELSKLEKRSKRKRGE